MAKNPAQERITHNFISDGSPYDKCKKCIHFTREEGYQHCKKFDRFVPTIGFTCYKFNPNQTGGDI